MPKAKPVLGDTIEANGRAHTVEYMEGTAVISTRTFDLADILRTGKGYWRLKEELARESAIGQLSLLSDSLSRVFARACRPSDFRALQARLHDLEMVVAEVEELLELVDEEERPDEAQLLQVWNQKGEDLREAVAKVRSPNG